MSSEDADALAQHIPGFINDNYQQYVETHRDAILALLNGILSSIA